MQCEACGRCLEAGQPARSMLQGRAAQQICFASGMPPGAAAAHPPNAPPTLVELAVFLKHLAPLHLVALLVLVHSLGQGNRGPV